jgi:hypothetical protein
VGDLLDRASELVRAERAWRVLAVDEPAAAVSERMLGFLEALRCLGREITFVSGRENAQERQHEKSRELGVAVLHGFPAVAEHLAARGHEYGFVLLRGPRAAERYLTVARSHALRAKVIYDTLGQGSERDHRLERIGVECTDLTLTRTTAEREALLRDLPAARIDVLPDFVEGRLSEGASLDRLASVFSLAGAAGAANGATDVAARSRA